MATDIDCFKSYKIYFDKEECEWVLEVDNGEYDPYKRFISYRRLIEIWSVLEKYNHENNSNLAVEFFKHIPKYSDVGPYNVSEKEDMEQIESRFVKGEDAIKFINEYRIRELVEEEKPNDYELILEELDLCIYFWKKGYYIISIY